MAAGGWRLAGGGPPFPRAWEARGGAVSQAVTPWQKDGRVGGESESIREDRRKPRDRGTHHISHLCLHLHLHLHLPATAETESQVSGLCHRHRRARLGSRERAGHRQGTRRERICLQPARAPNPHGHRIPSSLCDDVPTRIELGDRAAADQEVREKVEMSGLSLGVRSMCGQRPRPQRNATEGTRALHPRQTEST